MCVLTFVCVCVCVCVVCVCVCVCVCVHVCRSVWVHVPVCMLECGHKYVSIFLPVNNVASSKTGHSQAFTIIIIFIIN